MGRRWRSHWRDGRRIASRGSLGLPLEELRCLLERAEQILVLNPQPGERECGRTSAASKRLALRAGGLSACSRLSGTMRSGSSQSLRRFSDAWHVATHGSSSVQNQRTAIVADGMVGVSDARVDGRSSSSPSADSGAMKVICASQRGAGVNHGPDRATDPSRTCGRGSACPGRQPGGHCHANAQL